MDRIASAARGASTTWRARRSGSTRPATARQSGLCGTGQRPDLPPALRLSLRLPTPALSTSVICASSVPSELEDLLDVLVQGSYSRSRGRRGFAAVERAGFGAIHELARETTRQGHADPRRRPSTSPSIGVLTDIKVKTLLVGLRTRYDLPDLAVSDTFTASYMLERHLGGARLCREGARRRGHHGVERPCPLPRPAAACSTTSRDVVARYGASRATAPTTRTSRTCLPTRTRSFGQYLALTERRSLDVYERIKRDEHLPDLGSAASFLNDDARVRRS